MNKLIIASLVAAACGPASIAAENHASGNRTTTTTLQSGGAQSSATSTGLATGRANKRSHTTTGLARQTKQPTTNSLQQRK